jgi:putative transposase
MIKMNAKTFAVELYESIVNDNLRLYQDLFNNTDTSTVKDQYWKEAIGFYRSLSDEDKVVFFKVVKQVEIDTISNVLGVLDGVVSMSGFNDEIDVMLRKNQEKINGDLQDLFLEYDEDNR